MRQWLLNTENTTKKWVDAAISQDKVLFFSFAPYVLHFFATFQFEAESTDGHSSSIVDLFDSLRSPINFLQDLEWEDEYQEARFFTSLAKVLSFTNLPKISLVTHAIDGFQGCGPILLLRRKSVP